MKYTRQQIEKAVKSKKYKWFDSKDLELNIVGIRNSSSGAIVTNLFDDLITVTYKEKGVWKYFEWSFTADPGKKAMFHFKNSLGVARLVPGQYLDSHVIGLHRGQYEAICQAKPLKVYRDSNKDLKYDAKVIKEGIYGINIHRSSPKGTSIYVENWSEGCQVFANSNDFATFMWICKKASKVNGNKFTYTLIESKDIV